MKAIKRVAIVYKQSNLDIYRHTVGELRGRKKISGFVDRHRTEIADKLLKRGHDAHALTLEAVARAVDELELRARWFRRDALKAFRENEFELVITVGGDGTLLGAASLLRQTPALAVNSAPLDSIGYFAAAQADSVEECLRQIVAGERSPVPVRRLQVKIDQSVVGPPALNDVLFAHPSPAATTRFSLRVPGARKAEEQKTSGLWVATAAGSSGAIASAGGKRQDLADDKLQYLVREPYLDRVPYEFRAGLIPPRGSLTVESRMPVGVLYFDGWVNTVSVNFGAKISFARSPSPLLLYVAKVPPARKPKNERG